MPAARETPPWWLPAAWPAPAQVRAGITTRLGGGSRQKYTGFNLALHVGDEPSAVSANRVELRQRLNLPQEPCWLQQIHGNHVVPAAEGPAQPADGSYTTSPGPVCTILVADCVPLLLADFSGHQVAAIHAGWRGIAAGIVDAALAVMHAPPGQVLAWIGPCIGPNRYAVGAEVRSACLQMEPDAAECFQPTVRNHWRADLRRLVRTGLQRHGVGAIHDTDICVYDKPEHFFSHRRDGQTGRMAALIWIDKDQP